MTWQLTEVRSAPKKSEIVSNYYSFKHFSVSDWPKYFGLFFTTRYHYQVWKTLDVNCTDIVWVRDSRTRSSSAVLGKLRIFLSPGGHSLIWPRLVRAAEQGMVFRVMQFYKFTSWTRCFSDWKRRLAMRGLHERYPYFFKKL